MENKNYIISDKEIFSYGLKQFIKDVESILIDFNQNERIDILDTYIKIAQYFLEEKEYAECYKVYEQEFLRKYLQKSLHAEQIRIFYNFSYEGLRWNYANTLSQNDKQWTTEFTEEYTINRTLDPHFKNLLKTYINDLQKLLHIVLVYHKNSNFHIKENLGKINTVNHKETKLQKQGNKTLNINEDIIKDIEKLLHPFINPAQHTNLTNALNNVPINEKIIFNDNFNKLTDVFWLLSKNDVGLILGYKTLLIKWLGNNFRYTDEKGLIKDLDRNVLHKYIYTQSRKCANPISGIDILITRYKK